MNKQVAQTMKNEMSKMSVQQKYEYIQKKYLELWEMVDDKKTLTVGNFLLMNFKEELEQIKNFKKGRKV